MKPTKRGKRKIEVESASDDEMDIKEEFNNNNSSSHHQDHLLKTIATVKRKGGEAQFITFHKNSQLKILVQMICQNYNKKGQPNTSVTVEDLFYARPVLKNIALHATDAANAEVIDEDEESNPIVMEEALQTAIKDSARNDLQSAGLYAKPPGLDNLVEWIEIECFPLIEEANTAIAKNHITFNGLAELFKPDVKVVGRQADTGVAPIGYFIYNSRYHSCNTLRGKLRWFTMSMRYVVSSGSDSFLFVHHSDTIDFFPTTLPVNRLAYHVMSSDMEKTLTERGKKYVSLVNKPHFMSYENDGFCIHRKSLQGLQAHSTENSLNATFLRTKGRVMLDMDTGRRLGHYPAENNYLLIQTIQNHQAVKTQVRQQAAYNPYAYQQQNHNQNSEMKLIPDSLLYLCWPVITGFSFTSKVWGHVIVDCVKEIQFDDKAFEQLVLKEDRKKLIHAMVKHSEGVFKDIISGKGGGSIFLLHGPPGVGKTLTAEAVAEMLHRPLYSVSLGELGTNPTELENNLKSILDLASIWNALVLLDEADIFLEARSKSEIIRNAMVGVMLKLIEYYQGVLFLTTNRVEEFDEAFYSRITVALKYEPLTDEVREHIWQMLLGAAQVKGMNTNELKNYPLNGRQIKNCISLSQGLAKGDETEVTKEHIDRTIRICMEFVQEMERSKANKRKTLDSSLGAVEDHDMMNLATHSNNNMKNGTATISTFGRKVEAYDA